MPIGALLAFPAHAAPRPATSRSRRWRSRRSVEFGRSSSQLVRASAPESRLDVEHAAASSACDFVDERSFLLLVTVVFAVCGGRRRRAAAQCVRPAARRAARQRGGVGDGRRERPRDQAAGVHAVGRHGRLRRCVPRDALQDAQRSRRRTASQCSPARRSCSRSSSAASASSPGALFAGMFGLDHSSSSRTTGTSRCGSRS